MKVGKWDHGHVLYGPFGQAFLWGKVAWMNTVQSNDTPVAETIRLASESLDAFAANYSKLKASAIK
jgi:hypothetical protein|tara:strand:+ start:675 stop:872 length:198 start_codon:yes stop_codon:yes gene_type:complete